LNFVSHFFVCFIRSFKPSRTRSARLFTYPLNCSKRNERISLVHFLLIAMLVFALYPKRLFRSMKGLCLLQEVYGKELVFSLGRVFTCLLGTSFSPLIGRFFDHPFSPMPNF
jgi:hypothetical protein